MPKKVKNSRKKLLDLGNYNLSTRDPEQFQHSEFRSLTLRKSQALEFLNGANMPSKFRFREKEIERIQGFLESCLSRERKGYRFLMVTGSPGAGKSLSINSVLSGLECQVIRLNANLVKTVGEVQQLICQKLLCDSSARTAPQILRQLQQVKYVGSCVVCIEQIELLFKNGPTIVSEDFLTLFLKRSVNLILVGISNTIDAIQKYSGNYSFKVSEIENVVFAPYKAEHIMSIMQDKLVQIKQRFNITVDYSEKLLKFSAQKLQTLKKGDFRICLQFLKELVMLSFKSLSEQEQQAKYVINIGLINTTFSKMHISKNELMATLPYQQVIILIAMHNIITRTEALFVSLKELGSEMKWICGSLQVNFNASLLDERLNDLAQYGMLQLRKKTGSETRVILQVSSEQIRSSFEGNQLLGKYIVSRE